MGKTNMTVSHSLCLIAVDISFLADDEQEIAGHK